MFSPFVGSAPENVERMLKLAKLRDGDVVADLGSGDGRIVIGAAKLNPTVRGWGVDIDAKLVKESNESAESEGVAGRVRFFRRNVFDADLRNVDVIFMWLFPELQRLLRTKLIAAIEHKLAGGVPLRALQLARAGVVDVRCQRCHDASRTVQDTACLKCHAARIHSRFETHTPACRECHVEHRGAPALLAIHNASCVGCHGQLASKRTAPLIQASIKGFATHPAFVPLRPGRRDETALRFNHKVHLTSDKIPRDDKLVCASCHQPAPDGRLMRPIVFEPHCQRCHEQQPPNPFGGIKAPHETPEVVRTDLQKDLLMFAAQSPEGIFKGRPSMLPGVAERPSLSAASTLQGYQSEWIEKLETVLYQPFDETPPLLEHNKYCFLCHVQQGDRIPGALAQLRETKIPRRWLERGGFSHRTHDPLACKTCHAAVEKSALTSDTNLPAKELCMKCHMDGTRASASTDCVRCHLYHDTSKSPELRARKKPEVTLEVLTGG